MLRSGRFADKRILLIDRAPKQHNDRTWCFWETGPGFFEDIVHHRWPKAWFLSPSFSELLDLAPYEYKMIRGGDFYRYCMEEVGRHGNVEFLYGNVDQWESRGGSLTVTIDGNKLEAGGATVFNSIYEPGPAQKHSLRLLQHFKGWVIESDQAAFDPGKATLMDFRVSQQRGTAFAYVLPFSATRALVEYTLFTRELLQPWEYDEALRDYMVRHLRVPGYTIQEEEFGIIPMTNEHFPFGSRGWNIGTAGGQTKASSGYTFQFIQKNSEQILDCLARGGDLSTVKAVPARFRFYDNTLLHILYHDRLPGSEIFTRLFRRNKTAQVLKFLDNESNLREELEIISVLPKWEFLKAALVSGRRGRVISG